MIDKRIGKRIKQCRERLGLSWIEDPGSMRLRDLWDLAEIIGAPVGELAGGDLPEEMLAKLLQQKLL